jgi:hypothetical protein
MEEKCKECYWWSHTGYCNLSSNNANDCIDNNFSKFRELDNRRNKMSHTAKVNLIADQEVQFFAGYDVNIHDIITISLNGIGQVVEVVTAKAVYTKKGIHPLAPETDLCQICKGRVDNHAGDPSKWGICLPYHNGRGEQKTYHMGCVTEVIEKRIK